MKILDRYIGKDVVVTSLFAVAVLSLVLVAGNIFKQLFDVLVSRDVPLELILTFIGFILPFSLTFTIPWGFLTAVLLVFGKLSAENELIALRSNGVSIPRICAPLAVIAIAYSLICCWINVSVAPEAQTKMKNALFTIATGNPIALFSSDHVIDEFPGKKIYVERKEGRALFNIMVYELTDAGVPLTVIHARSGSLEVDLPNKQVLMKLEDLRFEQRDETAPNDFTKIRFGMMQEAPFAISLTQLYEKNKNRPSLTQMTLKELLESEDRTRVTAAHTEASKRFSFSFATFAFALIGVPLAITAHRKETSIGFLFSIMVAFVYFFLFNIADTVHDKPKFHPELLIWAPNVIFIALGGFLFYRLSKK